MKGHLDAEQLKDMQRGDLQKLAKDLGVGAGGKNEEIIARIAAVELDISEDELTDEEKTAFAAEQKAREDAEAAQQEEERATAEVEAREDAEAAKEAEEKAATEQKAREDAEAAAKLVKVKVVTRFLDKQLDHIKETDEIYNVSRERAAELVAAGVVEIVV